MEYETIKQLMQDMENSTLSSLSVHFPNGSKISMKKEVTQESRKEAKPVIKNEIEENTEENRIQGNVVTSPMVGTFYLKPSPTSQPYVEVGKEVKKGDTLCIIEAMKLMNEIESEWDGKIIEILVKDGEAVEYGKPLFRIK